MSLNVDSGKALPRVPALDALYRRGCNPRQGEFIMVAGRSGTQKSGFAMWWVDEMKLPTLYFSADMSPFTAASRLACKATGYTTEGVEEMLARGGRHAEEIYRAMRDSNITFSFGPITWRGVDENLDAYVELHNTYPKVMVFDNLMDIQGSESDYSAQMESMQTLSELSRETGATVIVLHHASDKSWDARTDPWAPPSRDQVKGGLAEKPELALSVALDPTSLEYKIAVLKQRMGPCDPTGRQYATLLCDPAHTRFHAYRGAPPTQPQGFTPTAI